ncbi:MAG: hypothetical protein NT133_16975 [Alphaproteobacteria bacterium]|nr:hypothetical protein [Alphaproteobacteria bacterium]
MRKTVPGEIMNVVLDERPAGWTYGLTVLTPEGEYCDVTVDAKRVKLMQMTWR